MRVPLSWLREFVDLEVDLNELSNRLEMAGLSVEAVEQFGDDMVLNLEVTPNRGDWLSVEGVAREVAAIFDIPMKRITPFVCEEADEITNHVSISVEDTDFCPRYSARLISGITVGESPMWLQEKLLACGQTPINNVVDVTNYVMFGFGQPLHAFDFEKIAGGRVIVRRAVCGETIITLDGELRVLSDDMLVIADERKPIAVAGVMGGLESEVTPQTSCVLLESAHFLNSSIRRTAKRLGMRTEASYRFERWVDPNGTVRALDLAAELIVRVAGGRVHRGVIDIYPNPIKPREVRLRVSRVCKLLGIEISQEEAKRLLLRLGLVVRDEGEGILFVSVPTWRNDIEQEADLIEEIARLYGYERIPATLPKGVSERSGESERRIVEMRCKELLTRLGLSEVVTYSLTSHATQSAFGFDSGDNAILVRNPLVKEYCMLRTTLLPSLLSVVETNMRRGVYDVWIFELGKVYSLAPGTMRHEERRHLCLIVSGAAQAGKWGAKSGLIADFYTLKGIVEELLNALGITSAEYVLASHEAFHPYQTAHIIIGGTRIGVLGRINPRLEREHDFRNPVYAAEIDFEELVGATQRVKKFKPLPTYPAVMRDLAFVVPEDVEAAAVAKVISEACGEFAESVVPFDEYRSEQLGVGVKSLAFSITLRAADRTLSGKEVEELMERAKRVVCERFNAKVRQ
ncbi:MAG: phenylalanine--tRNA ligase subunit beta [Armatimonadota bacterium]|nr:phenylalanine--tRNA ligase subunit beta [Armatimonadota bacterium]MCX7778511.1 phenylalanine--tRNA ligase subunit beta [Armatimonadota bacterium]MDW8024943.1 phenylalanine--tRNA ligase subunit beta [Armatimonadota bacterium]